MGAYFGMELNTMASMLYGQRAEPWHAGADIWGSASQQLLSTNGDLGAANAVLGTWAQSVNSASQVAFQRGVIGSQASLAEWATYTGSMSAALRLGGTALHAAQAVMPALQSGYDTAIALSTAPIIGPIAAQAAAAIQTTGAGMMEAVGGVMQAPRAVPPPPQGWQGPSNGNGAATPGSPLPAVPAGDVLNAADKLMGVLDKGATLTQKVIGLAGSAGSAGTDGVGDLAGMDRPDLPGLAGGDAPGAPLPGSGSTANSQHPGGVSPGVLAGGGALGALGGAALRNGGAGQFTTGIPGARIGAGTEPALAGGAARTATAGAGRPPPAIAPPLAPGGGGGGGVADARQGGRPGTGTRANEQEERLQRNGVQSGLQGRAAREPVERFGLAPVRRRRRGGNGDAVLDEELFAAEAETANLDPHPSDRPAPDRPAPDRP